MRWHAIMDTRRWGPGERIVFEPYTREVFERDLPLDRRPWHFRRRKHGFVPVRAVNCVGWTLAHHTPSPSAAVDVRSLGAREHPTLQGARTRLTFFMAART